MVVVIPGRRTLATLAGGLAVLAVLGLLLTTEPVPLDPDEPLALATVAGIAGIVTAAVLLWRAGRSDRDRTLASPPWASAGALAPPATEETPTSPKLAGENLSGRIADAVHVARVERDVDQGVAVVRAHLREPLAAMLSRGGPEAEVDRLIRRGAWTDDQLAASVLSDRVPPPDLPLAGRVRVWLLPGVVTRERIERAVQAIDDVASEQLPPVPGSEVPRQPPTERRRLAELHRGIDGSLTGDPGNQARGSTQAGEDSSDTTGGQPTPEREGNR